MATASPTAMPSSNQPPASQPITEEPNVPTVRINHCRPDDIAQLADNPTAQDLTDQLPLTLTFQDFNRVEEVAELPRPLTMDGVPAGDDPTSTTSATTPPLAASSSTTATLATGTASSASAGSPTATSN